MELFWLPIHPDFRGALTAARCQPDAESGLVAAARLSGYRREFVATAQLARLIDTCAKSLGGLEQARSVKLTPARVAILASHTVDQLVPSIQVACLHRRLALSTHVATYGLYRQLLLRRDARLAEFAPQFIVLAADAHDISFDLPLDAPQERVDQAIAARVEEIRRLWRGARELYSAQVIQQTLVPAAPPLFGSFEGLVPAAPFAMTESLNTAIRYAARQDGVLLLDLAWHAARNSDAVADPVRWHQAKQLVSPLLAPLYGDLLARVVAAAMGLSRKCLVLDLDNTLWGGVLGDDGSEGLRLGNGTPSGEAFLAFQRYVGLLATRGIVLAVCSKNDPAIAEAAFSTHPEMALRRSDIACFVANWEDKASNLRHIARTLDLGSDSLVFVDDNPAERDLIRRELPEVAVPELPDDVAHYASVLSAAGYFESASFTADDAARSSNYAANVERRSMHEAATDLDGYLRGLEMSLVVTGLGSVELPRAAQLINKSNQFNLTTRRYTEAELANAAARPATIAACLRLVDRFGDNGLISVVLARPDELWRNDELLIDVWLMSCRVLGRQVEVAALEVLANEAARRGIAALIGEYRPTPRNALVADHYAKLGFTAVAAPPRAVPGATFWRYQIAEAARPTHFIKLKDQR